MKKTFSEKLVECGHHFCLMNLGVASSIIYTSKQYNSFCVYFLKYIHWYIVHGDFR